MARLSGELNPVNLTKQKSEHETFTQVALTSPFTPNRAATRAIPTPQTPQNPESLFESTYSAMISYSYDQRQVGLTKKISDGQKARAVALSKAHAAGEKFATLFGASVDSDCSDDESPTPNTFKLINS